jgi:hypothetical protein
MIKLSLLAVLFTLIGCNNSSFIIIPSISKEVAEKLDTINAINEYRETDLEDLFNSDLRISYDNSDFFDSFASGGISIDDKGIITITYRLSESSGPVFTIKISKNNKVISGKFRIAGDDSPSSSEVDIKLKSINFNRLPELGKSICFYIEFTTKKWSFPKGEKQASHLKIYGFVNEIVDTLNE